MPTEHDTLLARVDAAEHERDALEHRVEYLETALTAAQEGWRKDGLALREQIESHRLALRYIAGEDIAGWEAHMRPEDVARDELVRNHRRDSA